MRKFFHFGPDGVTDIENPCVESFGITEAISAFIVAGLTDVGVGAATAGTLGSIGAGAIEGGVIGAVTNPKNPLKGAEFGAISGGVGAGVSPFVSELGLGETATGALSGALGGAAGSLATGGNVATGALEGGVAGGLSGALKPSSGASSAPSTGATSAVSTAAPTGVSAAPAGTSNVTITPPGTEVVNVTGEHIPGADPSLSGAIAASGIGQAGGRPPKKEDGATTTLTAPPVTPSTDLASSIRSTVPAVPPTTSSGIGGWLKENPWAIPAAGVGISALKGNQPLPGQKELAANASALNAQGKDLQGYLKSGTLPPGLQLGIKQASEAAKASIRSMYASAGQSGSSAEQQDLAAVDERAAAQGSQIALNLLQQGVSEQGVANQLYLELMGQALQQDQQLGQAIASFSSALIPSAPPATPAPATG